jgi:hypothetical protein
LFILNLLKFIKSLYCLLWKLFTCYFNHLNYTNVNVFHLFFKINCNKKILKNKIKLFFYHIFLSFKILENWF